MNLNGWAQNKYKLKEKWNIFYHRKAIESPESLSNLFSNSNNENKNNKNISLTNYKSLNNTELRRQEKLRKLFT